MSVSLAASLVPLLSLSFMGWSPDMPLGCLHAVKEAATCPLAGLVGGVGRDQLCILQYLAPHRRGFVWWLLISAASSVAFPARTAACLDGGQPSFCAPLFNCFAPSHPGAEA